LCNSDKAVSPQGWLENDAPVAQPDMPELQVSIFILAAARASPLAMVSRLPMAGVWAAVDP